MPRKRTILEANLLDAARSVFAEKGFGVSVKEIARRARVSEGILFQRYHTKADLFFAAMAPPPFELKEHLQRVTGPEGLLEAVQKLSAMMLEYLRGAAPVLAQLMSHPDFRFEEFAKKHPDSGLVSLRRDLMAFFEANHAPDPPAAALLLIASLHGIAMFERLGAHEGRMPPEIVNRMILSIWKGVKS